MNQSSIAAQSLPDFPLWERLGAKRRPLAFDLELTARCNNNCLHCYINLPAGDRVAQARELSLAEIVDIAGQAVELGAEWCLLTGGEPLLTEDFPDIYLALKRLGLLSLRTTESTSQEPEAKRKTTGFFLGFLLLTPHS